MSFLFIMFLYDVSNLMVLSEQITLLVSSLSSVKAILCVPHNALESDCQRRCGKSSAETVFPGVSDLPSLHQGFLNVPASVSYPLCRRWCHNPWGTSQALDPFSGSTWNPHLHQSPSRLLPSRPIHHAPLPRGQGMIRIPNPLPASLSLEAECSNCGDLPPIPLAGVTWHTWAITFSSLTIFGLFFGGGGWLSFSLFPARFICLLVLCGKEAPV